MASDDLTLSCDAIDWDLWLQNDHVPSFEENYFLPDFDSPIWHTGIDELPGLSQPGIASQDILTMDERELNNLFSNIDSAELSSVKAEQQVFPKQEDPNSDAFTRTSPPDINESALPSSQLAPASPMPPPAPSQSLSCDWPSCTRTLPNQSTYKQHYKNHTRPFKCPACPARRATRCHLTRHFNERHHAAEKFYCPVHGCIRSKKHFPRSDNLKRHMKTHGLVDRKRGV